MRPGELVAGLGGLALGAALWLHWYDDATAWSAFAVCDVLLAAYAVLALAIPLVAAAARGPATPVAIDVVASAIGPALVLLVAYRLLDPPGPDAAVDVRAGAWLGLAALLLAWAGAWLALRDESTPGAVAPDVPVRRVPG